MFGIVVSCDRDLNFFWLLSGFSGAVAREGEFYGDEVGHSLDILHRPVSAYPPLCGICAVIAFN